MNLRPGERVEVTLVPPSAYAMHVNQIGALTNTRALFIRRKELAMEPYALEYYELSGWNGLTHRKVHALWSMLAGATMVPFGLLLFVLWATGLLEMGIHAVWLSFVMCFGGAALVVGVRRRELRFTIGDRRFRWRSAPGEFRQAEGLVAAVVRLAESRGIPTGRTEPIQPE